MEGKERTRRKGKQERVRRWWVDLEESLRLSPRDFLWRCGTGGGG